MAKLTRVLQNLFGRDGNQSHFGQFGSRRAGAPFNTKDPASIQALSAFLNNGWLDAINSSNKAPFLEDVNGLFYLIIYQLCYGFQEGIPEWNSGTTYYTGSIVKKTGTSELYASLVDNNTGNALPSQTDNGFWHFVNPPTILPGVIQDWGGSVIPSGYLECDGSSYPQASYPALFAAIGATWNTFHGNADPGVGNFRVPDLRGVTTIGAGQGIGLSLRTLAQFIGEENHVLVVGEMPAHAHGVTDPGHFHSAPNGQNFAVVGSLNNRGIPFSASAIFNSDFSTTASKTTGISIQNTGGDGGHNTMQPSAVVKKIIKT